MSYHSRYEQFGVVSRPRFRKEGSVSMPLDKGVEIRATSVGAVA